MVGACQRRKRRRGSLRYTTPRRRASAPSRSASRRSPRWVSTRTVPGRLSMMAATRPTSNPATTRSTTASAWSAGSVATTASAARVENPSTAVVAGSSAAARSITPEMEASSLGRRAARRRQSSSSWRAMVNTQARNAGSLPRQRPRLRTTASQVSEARSSAAAGTATMKYRSRRGCRSRQSLPNASSSPRVAASSTAGNSGPIMVISPGDQFQEANNLNVTPRACQTRGPPLIPRAEVCAHRSTLGATTCIPMASRHRRPPSRDPRGAPARLKGTYGQPFGLQRARRSGLVTFPAGRGSSCRTATTSPGDDASGAEPALARWTVLLTQRRRLLVVIAALSAAATATFVAGVGSASAGPNPPGNNGTIKIDDTPFDDLPNNEPHVGCTFQVDFYGYDEGDLDATVTFEAHLPTQRAGDDQVLLTDTVFIGEDDNSGGGSEAGLDASETYTLDFTGITPHPVQGFHVKL